MHIDNMHKIYICVIVYVCAHTCIVSKIISRECVNTMRKILDSITWGSKEEKARGIDQFRNIWRRKDHKWSSNGEGRYLRISVQRLNKQRPCHLLLLSILHTTPFSFGNPELSPNDNNASALSPPFVFNNELSSLFCRIQEAPSQIKILGAFLF